MSAKETICGATFTRLGGIISIITVRARGKTCRIERVIPSNASGTSVGAGVANKAMDTVAGNTYSIDDHIGRRDTLCASLSIRASIAIRSALAA